MVGPRPDRRRERRLRLKGGAAEVEAAAGGAGRGVEQSGGDETSMSPQRQTGSVSAAYEYVRNAPATAVLGDMPTELWRCCVASRPSCPLPLPCHVGLGWAALHGRAMSAVGTCPRQPDTP